MKRIILILVAILVLQINLSAEKITISEEEQRIMLNEADDLIDEIAEGEQDRMADAVLHAMHSQGMELSQLRNRPSQTYSLPDGVEKTGISGTGAARGIEMTLFKKKNSELKDNEILLFFHGGGWSIGSADDYTAFCSQLVEKYNVSIIVPEYSLAPEKGFPAGLQDCISVIEYLFSDSSELGSLNSGISIGGDGAGGNLALCAGIYFAQNPMPNIRINKMLLYYPIVGEKGDAKGSWQKYGRGYGLDSRLMEIFNDAYSYGENKNEMSFLKYPLNVNESLFSKLPPMLLIWGSRDIFHDRIIEFTKNLESSSIKFSTAEYTGAIHGFLYGNSQPTALSKSVELSGKFLVQ